MWKVSYDGKPLSDFGIRAICKNPYDAPQPNIETTHVDGMSGDLHFAYGDFQNVNADYLCIIDRNFHESYKAFKSWLLQRQGYKRLEDDAYPEHYRMGIVLSQPIVGKVHNSFNLSFSCKPQRYLKSGEESITFSSSGVIYNHTQCTALPLIRVYGTGNLGIGSQTINFTSNDGYTDIDCELQDAYRVAENRNGNIQLLSGGFFSLRPGENGIKLDTGMRIELIPRWYEL